eukprot:g7365.t1 g7365   contig24:441116-445003(+)
MVPFPPLPSQLESANDINNNGPVDILAYGGDNGTIYLLPSGDATEPKAIRTYDECVRALAISPDGLRVAVGFDEGESKIYSYDDFVPAADEATASEGIHHPFILQASTEQDSGFLSQSFSQADGSTTTAEFEGPRLASAYRQMAFDPRCNSGAFKDKYYLAIVSENGDHPFVIVNVKSEETCETVNFVGDGTKAYFGGESHTAHDGGGARSLAYSPFLSGVGTMFLATLGMDGKMVTWNVSGDDPDVEWESCSEDAAKCVERVDAGELANDAGDGGCNVVWGVLKSGSEDPLACLLLPGKTNVQFRVCPLTNASSTSDCGEHLLKQLSCGGEGGVGHKDTIVAMAFEPSGKRFVTGGRDGKLLLWELSLEEGVERVVTGEFVGEIDLKRAADTTGIPPVTSIVWVKEGGECVLYAANASGAVSVVRTKDGEFEGMTVAKRATSSTNEEEMSEEEEEADGLGDLVNEFDTGIEENEIAAPKETDRKNVLTESDDEEVEGTFDEDATPPTKTALPKKMDASKFIDDEAEADDDDETVALSTAPQPAITEANSPAREEGKNVNDDEPEDADFDFDNHNNPMDDNMDDRQPMYSLPPLQPAFAPSSTPITEPRRILCWNHVGVVTSYPDPESPQYSTIDIAFHDAAGLVGGRRPVTFMDNLGFIVGTLGDEGAFFATDVIEEVDDDDDIDDDEFLGLGAMSEAARSAVKRSRRKKKGGSGNKGSQVYFNRFETFGRNADKDWSVSLPSGERVLGCATGRGWGAVMTSRRYLRLFTTAGIQGPVLWLSGEPVTVVGRDRFVAVFYHRSDPTQDGTQQLGYSIIDGINGTTITKGDVSGISPGGSLTWAGFTEVCALSVMDSDGMLSMLARPAPTEQPSINIGNWVPMLDTMGLKKLMSDIYWPVEVHGGKLVCVLLRGGREYPDAARRPVTTTLSLRIPLAAGLTKFGHMEELSIRGNIALNQQKVLNDYKVSQGEENAADLEDEYAQLSAQIDKVTLQLFNNIVREGKVERAFDLTQRLHLEKSYDIAVQVSDRVGHRKLSDRIEELKLQKYPIFDEEEEDFFDDNASVEYRERNDSFEEEPVVATRQQRMEMMQHISPDSMQTPKVRRSETDVREESTDEESPPRESLKRKLENDTVVQVKKRNPFAKKPMKSPAKPISKMPASPAKLSLSRQSTFSTKSRQKQRSGKQIL